MKRDTAIEMSLECDLTGAILIDNCLGGDGGDFRNANANAQP